MTRSPWPSIAACYAATCSTTLIRPAKTLMRIAPNMPLSITPLPTCSADGSTALKPCSGCRGSRNTRSRSATLITHGCERSKRRRATCPKRTKKRGGNSMNS
ncbi:hypothetical protein FRX94_01490 [Corynebacterium canis]|uniref:Uncharacterized protein n=1 Tax=Corynebacterium canis TaxID=679663 RepID=A0A5C5US77_9CORY|nr:hypothetical protein FRX94_01490 [Corynebacterium canis]